MHTAPLLLHALPLYLDASNPVENPFGWLADSLARVAFAGGKPGDVARNLLGGLFPAITGQRVSPSSSPLNVLGPDCGNHAQGCAFAAAWDAVSRLGYVFLSVALLLRLLRGALHRGDRGATHVLIDLLPRLIGGCLAIPISLTVLARLGDVSLTLANILSSAIVSAFQPQPSEVGSLVGQSMALAPFLICGLLAYVGLLVFLSRLALILVTIAAPLGIPVALYRGEGRLTAMWGRMLMSSLAVPVVAAVGLAASIGVGVALQRATWWFVVPMVGGLLPSVATICGLLLVAIAATAFFKDSVEQGLHGVKGSFEAVHLGAVARVPGEIRDQLRDKVGMAAGAAASVATGNPLPLMASAQAAQGRGSEDRGSEDQEIGQGDDVVWFYAGRYQQNFQSARQALAAMTPEERQAFVAVFLSQRSGPAQTAQAEGENAA
jgi:hypothetical protein